MAKKDKIWKVSYALRKSKWWAFVSLHNPQSGWLISSGIYWINTQPFFPNRSKSFAIVKCVAEAPGIQAKTKERIDRTGSVFLFVLTTSILYIVHSLQQSSIPTQLVQGTKNWIIVYFSSVFSQRSLFLSFPIV